MIDKLKRGVTSNISFGFNALTTIGTGYLSIVSSDNSLVSIWWIRGIFLFFLCMLLFQMYVKKGQKQFAEDSDNLICIHFEKHAENFKGSEKEYLESVKKEQKAYIPKIARYCRKEKISAVDRENLLIIIDAMPTGECLHLYEKNNSTRGVPVRYHRPMVSSLEIFERDNYKCVECKSTEGLEIDHITPLAEFSPSKGDGQQVPVELRVYQYSKANLQTLCANCHRKKHRAGH